LNARPKVSAPPLPSFTKMRARDYETFALPG